MEPSPGVKPASGARSAVLRQPRPGGDLPNPGHRFMTHVDVK